jgi:nitric oxide dioxygenase
VEGTQLPNYEAGQYITLRFHNSKSLLLAQSKLLLVPGSDAETTMRHYSLSTPPGESSFAISVQLEPGTDLIPGGLVSNYMRYALRVFRNSNFPLREHLNPGDIVELGMPFGTLKLRPTTDGRPVALISGGIGTPSFHLALTYSSSGCTVTVSMLGHIAKNLECNKLYYAHGVHDGAVHAYRNRVARLRSEFPDKINHRRFYSKPRPVDKMVSYNSQKTSYLFQGVDFDVEGRIDVAKLEEWMGPEDMLAADYVLCGPDALIHDVMQGLMEKGVKRDQIQFECFGPLGKSLDEFAI